jgi:hypothetical protein
MSGVWNMRIVPDMTFHEIYADGIRAMDEDVLRSACKLPLRIVLSQRNVYKECILGSQI